MLATASSVIESEFAFAGPVQRLLLKTDGTLTDLLEALHDEPLRVVLLNQTIVPTERKIDALSLGVGESVLSRKVLIKGQLSGETYIFAKSCIAVDRLDARIREGLLTTTVGLGQLWKRNRVETFKEVLDSGIESAGAISTYFGVSPESPLLARRTRISESGRPVTLITEHVRYPAL
jgi:chorismate-pyruvate lyase